MAKETAIKEKELPIEPAGQAEARVCDDPELAIASDLVEENGHLLFRSLPVDNWMQALQDQRESELIPTRDAYDR